MVAILARIRSALLYSALLYLSPLHNYLHTKCVRSLPCWAHCYSIDDPHDQYRGPYPGAYTKRGNEGSRCTHIAQQRDVGRDEGYKNPGLGGELPYQVTKFAQCGTGKTVALLSDVRDIGLLISLFFIFARLLMN